MCIQSLHADVLPVPHSFLLCSILFLFYLFFKTVYLFFLKRERRPEVVWMEDGGYLEGERKWETIIKIYCLKKCLFSIKKKNQKAKKGKSDEIKYLRNIFKIFKILTTKGLQI